MVPATRAAGWSLFAGLLLTTHLCLVSKYQRQVLAVESERDAARAENLEYAVTEAELATSLQRALLWAPVPVADALVSGAAEAAEAGGCAPRAGMLGVKKADKAVAAILALANVSIKPLESETTAGQGIFPTEVAADEVHASRVRRFGPKIPLAHVIEAHHRQYGGAWLKGRDQFDALVKYGLKPHHKILELGCGSLRSAVWTIAYLDAGNYFCIESNAESLRAGVMYELRLHGVLGKEPHLLRSDDFEIDTLVNRTQSTEPILFDFAFAFAVFIHICGGCRDNLCAKGVFAAASRLRVGGSFLISHKEIPRTSPKVYGLARPSCKQEKGHFTAFSDTYCHYEKVANVSSRWREDAIAPNIGKQCFANATTTYTIEAGPKRAAEIRKGVQDALNQRQSNHRTARL